jgi:hypothetical protein
MMKAGLFREIEIQRIIFRMNDLWFRLVRELARTPARQLVGRPALPSGAAFQQLHNLAFTTLDKPVQPVKLCDSWAIGKLEG